MFEAAQIHFLSDVFVAVAVERWRSPPSSVLRLFPSSLSRASSLSRVLVPQSPLSLGRARGVEVAVWLLETFRFGDDNDYE